MRPLFPFYGSKWGQARRHGPPASHVIEPFAGSAGYSTYWEPSQVTLIDADPIIVGVWDYLIRATAEQILALPDLDIGQDVRDLGLPQEAEWFIGFWLNRGSASPKRTRTAYSSRTDRAQLTWGERARRRVAATVHKVDHWTVRLGDYGDAPRDTEATCFVDPPYVGKGRFYRINTVDYPTLAAWSKSTPGHVIVCENVGANWLPFSPLAVTKSSRGFSHEAVWESGRREVINP
jgi:hypothetical protein